MEADNSISDDVKNLMIDHVMNGRWFSDVLDETYKD
jgi:para-nitrobenzyl esterase